MKKKNKLNSKDKSAKNDNLKNTNDEHDDGVKSVNYQTMGFYAGHEPKVTKQPRQDSDDI